MSTRYGRYDEPDRYQRREEQLEQQDDAKHARLEAAAGEPTMAAIRKSAATYHQRRSALLSMHATATRYRDDPRRTGDYRRQLATITAREAELQAIATPQQWREYQADRDAQAQGRSTVAAYRAAQDEAAAELAEAAALERGANQAPAVVEIRPPAPTIPAPDNRAAIATRVSCPQCHADTGASCTIYAGKNCAPHGQRHKAAQAAAGPAPIAAPRPQRQPKAAPPTVAADVDLEADMRALLTRYGVCAVIDAVWSTDAAMKPRPRA
jgi:hypothetical protein